MPSEPLAVPEEIDRHFVADGRVAQPFTDRQIAVGLAGVAECKAKIADYRWRGQTVQRHREEQ